MAGTVKEMSLIKQVLQLKQRGESNRGIARQLPINKETVGGYMQTIEANGWKIEDLLQTDDPDISGDRPPDTKTSPHGLAYFIYSVA